TGYTATQTVSCGGDIIAGGLVFPGARCGELRKSHDQGRTNEFKRMKRRYVDERNAPNPKRRTSAAKAAEMVPHLRHGCPSRNAVKLKGHALTITSSAESRQSLGVNAGCLFHDFHAGTGADARCAGFHHFHQVLVTADAAGGLDAHFRSDGCAHEGHIRGSCASRVEAGGSFHVVSAGFFRE